MAQRGEYFKVVDCVVYVSSVANPRKHTRKIQCLESFAEGVQASGDSVVVEWEHKYTPSRLAVMLGWATTNTGGRNIDLRKQIIADQRRLGFHTMCIDASCWKYLDDHSSYLRYSIGGPFYDRAEYANHNSTADKWQEISQRLNMNLLPMQKRPDGHVLICMQRDGGFAMKTLDPIDWLRSKIDQIRRHTNRTILIRPHPGDYRREDFEEFRGKHYRQRLNVHVQDHLLTSLVDNLALAHSAVFFNSSASVAAVCAGVPVFADDSSCVAWSVANHDVAAIESPAEFDTQQWAWDLAAAHWSDEDAKAGRVYQKFLPYLTRNTVTS
jgi:hypothetical protein